MDPDFDQETGQVVAHDVHEDMSANDVSTESSTIAGSGKSKNNSKSKKKEGREICAYVFAFQDCVPLCASSPQAAVLGKMHVSNCAHLRTCSQMLPV
jgi:hypothetical protein